MVYLLFLLVLLVCWPNSELSELELDEARRVIRVARFLCTQTSPVALPSMSRVVAMRSGDVEASNEISSPGYFANWKFDDTSSLMTGAEADRSELSLTFRPMWDFLLEMLVSPCLTAQLEGQSKLVLSWFGLVQHMLFCVVFFRSTHFYGTSRALPQKFFWYTDINNHLDFVEWYFERLG